MFCHYDTSRLFKILFYRCIQIFNEKNQLCIEMESHLYSLFLLKIKNKTKQANSVNICPLPLFLFKLYELSIKKNDLRIISKPQNAKK